MILDRIRQMKTGDRLVYWIKERESIRIAKELGYPKPWTDDPILQSYRFCNVRRMDDKVSKWLIENWYYKYQDHPNILLAVALARFFNLPDSLKEIEQPLFNRRGPFLPFIKEVLRNYRDQGHTIFNGAYMVRGNDGMDKIECVADFYVKPLKEVKVDTDSMERTHKALLPSYGMGSFMAGQIVADLRWAMSGSWLDIMTWAPMGPGSQRGLNWVLEEKLEKKWKQADFLKNLQYLVTSLKKKLDSRLVFRLEMMDYQNCLCEFDKYNRVLFNQGRPKQKYPGKE